MKRGTLETTKSALHHGTFTEQSRGETVPTPPIVASLHILCNGESLDKLMFFKEVGA